jgi:hypothetical protein
MIKILSPKKIIENFLDPEIQKNFLVQKSGGYFA